MSSPFHRTNTADGGQYSDIVVQIVDARNPLLFRCVDLEQYVNEVDPFKKNFLLLNKADLLSVEQRFVPNTISRFAVQHTWWLLSKSYRHLRKQWAEYFTEQGVNFAFFSAFEEGNHDEV